MAAPHAGGSRSCATAAKKGDFYMESRRPGGVLKNRFSDSPSGMRNAIMDVKY